MLLNEDVISTYFDNVLLAQNAEKDPDTGNWTSIHNDRDSFLIEMVDSISNQGYISFKRSPMTSGNITWTEVLRVNHDGTILLNTPAITPTAPGADQLKLLVETFYGRLVAQVKSASETVNLLQSVGFGRIWRQDTFPAGAKTWDLLIKKA